MAKRRVLLVDDEVTVLLTMKAVLEISGFDVDTAASAPVAPAKKAAAKKPTPKKLPSKRLIVKKPAKKPKR